MKRFDRNLIVLMASVLVVGLSIAALVGHYATPPPPPPLRQVPNAHIARPSDTNEEPTSGSAARAPVAGTGTARATINGAPVYGSTGGGLLDDPATAKAENAQLRKALAECQRKESHDYKVRNGSLSVGRKAEKQQGHLRSVVGDGSKYERLGVRQLPSMPSQSGQGSAAASQTVAHMEFGPVTLAPGEELVLPVEFPVQTAPDGGHTKEETWPASNMNALADASARSGQSGNSSRSASSVTGAPAVITLAERPSALDLTRSGKPSWSGPFNDFKGDWDAPPMPQPVVSPRMMAVMGIRRPSNPPEPTLPILCDEGDVHGRWGTEYFSQFPNHEYLADRCWLLHVWKREGGDLHCFLAIHGYPSPGCVYDLHVPWESYAGAHWLATCTTLSGCAWIPVDGDDRRGVTVQVPMDLPFEQPAILRSARGAMAGGGR